MRTKRIDRVLGLWLVLAAIVVGLSACDTEARPPYAENAWVRKMPPSAGMTAAYFSLHNPTKSPLTISAIKASSYREAQLHETLEIDGQARMRERTNPRIAPGETLRLKPGGMHLMLMGLLPDEQTETVDIDIQFDDGWQLSFNAPVLSDGPGATPDHE